VQVTLTEREITHAQICTRRQAEYPDLALVEVPMDVKSGLGSIFQ